MKHKTTKLSQPTIHVNPKSPFKIKRVDDEMERPTPKPVKAMEETHEIKETPKPMLEAAQPEREEEIERHASIAAAIMSKRRMANGGVIDTLDPKHEDDDLLSTGEVDIDDNGREMSNPMDHRNADILADNLDEDLMDAKQPMDSNEHGDDIEKDKFDMVSAIRRKMKMKNAMVK